MVSKLEEEQQKTLITQNWLNAKLLTSRKMHTLIELSIFSFYVLMFGCQVRTQPSLRYLLKHYA